MPIRKVVSRLRNAWVSLRLEPGVPPDEQVLLREAIRIFHRCYYDSKVWQDTHWLGVETQKCPLDLWIYQEIIFGLRPDVIVETGTWNGGSALYLASLCELVGSGKVIAVDIEARPGRPRHPRIIYLEGYSSTSAEAVSRVRQLIREGDKVMAILDSDHSESHVLDELRIYGSMVTTGQYLIVEDTNINGHPVLADFGPGPMEALATFLRESPRFEVDSSKEKFYMTFNPRGYLKKV